MGARVGRSFDHIVRVGCQVAVEYHLVLVDVEAVLQTRRLACLVGEGRTAAAAGIIHRVVAVHARIFGSAAALLPSPRILPIIL